MQLSSLGSGVGFLKAGFLGFAGSGKTYTAMLLAIGTRKRLGLSGPIALFDTEAGGQYVAPLVKRETGLELIGFQSRSFADAVDFLRETTNLGAAVTIVDSVSHIWKELAESFLEQRNKARAEHNRPPSNRLEFQDWAVIKNRWAQFANRYVNAPQHIVICGRAGYEWDFETREDGGKDLVKTGIKMKTEGEFGFEPSLLVQMDRIQIDAAQALAEREVNRAAGRKIEGGIKIKSAVYVRRATIIKDRFGVIDGIEAENPTFEFFAPYVEMLVPGAHAAVDLTHKTDMGVDDEGNLREWRTKHNRAVASENFWAALLAVWPGASAQEKLARQETVWKLLHTRSQTEVDGLPADKLIAATQAMPAAIIEVKAELAAREAAETATEEATKAARKSKPAKAEKVEA